MNTTITAEDLRIDEAAYTRVGINADARAAAARTLQKYHPHLITDTTQIPDPVTVIRLKGETLASEGNITTISGAPKGGKTAITNVIIAGAVAPHAYDGFPDLDIASCNGKAVIHFDTEQAKHKQQRNMHCILKRARLETCPPNLLSYNIRSVALEDYCTFTRDIVDAASVQFGGVHLIVIDGGADYITDVNDPEQSNEQVKFFEDLAGIYKAVVIVIVHVNPGSDKERGHFGSQLQRKSESVLSVKSQGDISYLEPKFLRSAGKANLPLIQFAWDKSKGYHTYTGVNENSESEKDVKRIAELKEIARAVFAGKDGLKYTDAIHALMKHTKQQSTKTKERFREMKAHGFIKCEDKLWSISNEL